MIPKPRKPADDVARIEVTIPLPAWTKPPLTKNDNRRTQNRHAVNAKWTAALEEARWMIRKARPPRLIGADVHLHWRQPDRRKRDADGAQNTLSALLDALVKEGVLPDDSWPYVPSCGVVTYPPAKPLPGELWLVLSNALEAK